MVLWRYIADWCKRRPLTLRLADRLGRGRGRCRWLDSLQSPPQAPHRPDLSSWNQQDLGALWLGHATVLLRLGGKTILTDPVLGNRIGVSLGLMTGGPSRLVAPALRVGELPPIDLVLISHSHFDHLDRPTLARLPRQTPVVTAWETRDLIVDLGFHTVMELRWGQQVEAGGVTVKAWEVKHWGARTYYDEHRGACAYLLSAGGRRVLFGGDTAYGEHFRGVGGVDLAVLGIGSYDPWIGGHANPEQALAMADHMQARYLMPMHHATFRLSHEAPDEPLRRLRAAAAADRLVACTMGQVWGLN